MKIAKETWTLALICTLDMVSTAWLLAGGRAHEANPILRFYANSGLAAFIAFKSLLFVAPLYVLELMRRRRPRFIQRLLRFGIAAYLLGYGLGVLSVNADARAQKNSPFGSVR